MKKKVFFEEETSLKRVQNYLLTSYERDFDFLDEDYNKRVINTGPNCIR